MRINILFGVLLVLFGLYISRCSLSKITNLNDKILTQEFFNTPIVFLYENRKDWEDLGDRILKSKAKIIYLEINGKGGVTDVLERFLYKIQKAQAQGKVIIGIIVGEAASCHALIACYMNKVIYAKDSSRLLFHYMAYYDNNGVFVGWPEEESEKLAIDNSLEQCVKMELLSREELPIIQIEHKRIIKTKYKTFIEKDPR